MRYLGSCKIPLDMTDGNVDLGEGFLRGVRGGRHSRITSNMEDTAKLERPEP